MGRDIELIGGTFEPWPSLDVAVTRALLLRVAAGELPETVRLYRPRPTVAFGRHDIVRSGCSTAARLAREAGFTVAQRLAGTRTIAYHDGCVLFEHCIPDTEPLRHLADRYTEAANTVATALRTFGIDARIGEIPGEFAPGMYSVNAQWRTKLAAIDQRTVDRATLIAGLVIVAGAEELRDVLLDVNDALGFEWDTTALGSVEDEVGEVDVAAVGDAIVEEMSTRHATSEAQVGPVTLEFARALEPEHRSPALTIPDAEASGRGPRR